MQNLFCCCFSGVGGGEGGGAFNAGVNAFVKGGGGGVIFDVDLKNVCSFLCSG